MAEIWDLYDGNGKRTGGTMTRGEAVPRGFFTLSASAWITDGRGRYIISKRHPAKKFPNLWECTGGGALSGESGLEAAVREVREELGIILAPREGRLIYRTRRDEYRDFYEAWLFRAAVPISSLALQPEEVTEARWASLDEIKSMRKSGLLHPLLDYLDELPS
ncbi:NUDIX domain-containing protein [Cloacibacillus sp. An23]|uniref:NUDIX hydrolase n=1 Tax=Cloacibacillus sp. An23 TaxID=1965591 RepID=UPI000B36647C|nr:NUDIX domain-containing protein [Cloacibacillus sp. An23]OUO93282.1 DNA mismatch repair protein MutT [Cloacibacillus sp. An23]